MVSKINFLIYGFDYDSRSGGVCALHQLAHILASKGENSYIYCNKTFEGSLAITTMNPNFLQKENTMVIYPEVVSGNPLGFKYITRWLLNTPGKLDGDGIYNDTDLIFKYYNYFKAPDETKVNGELRTYGLNFDIFNNKNQLRQGECFLIKKGINKILNKHSIGSICIDNYVNDEQLSEIFNKTERFISYDSMTFHLQQAALCGCIPIVIPDFGITKDEFISKAPVNKYGIAYGLDDIEYAKNTIHLVKDHLIEMQNESLELIDKYIDICYENILQKIYMIYDTI